jgi:hypothetical protein
MKFNISICIYISIMIAFLIMNNINNYKVNSLLKFSLENKIKNKRDTTVLENIITGKETGVKTRIVFKYKYHYIYLYY